MSTIYYTEYPMGQFYAEGDEEAKQISKALVIYKESDTRDGTPFLIIRESTKEERDNWPRK